MKFYYFVFILNLYYANSYIFSFGKKDIKCYHNIDNGTENFPFEKSPIDRKYLLLENIINNPLENYQRWIAKDINNGKLLFVKVINYFFLKSYINSFL